MGIKGKSLTTGVKGLSETPCLKRKINCPVLFYSKKTLEIVNQKR